MGLIGGITCLLKHYKMYQAGVKRITLYENKDITFRFYDPLNSSAITDLTSPGSQVLIENLQRPEYETTLKIGKSGKLTQEHSLSFLLLELSLINLDILNQLKTSMYGWCFLVEFYDGSFRFYNTPVFCKESDVKPHKDMAYSIKMQTAAPTVKRYYDYDPTIDVVPVYRWDTELISWDTEIYSFDYEL